MVYAIDSKSVAARLEGSSPSSGTIHMKETQLPKLIVVCGPTATGKSALAVEIAKAVGGEIVSADSRQVYRGMNLGTGKVTKKEMAGVPHFLLDVADPKRAFSVARYKKLADKSIKDILKRGKVPVLCGGTGFYIDAVASGIVLPEVKADAKLRAELSKKTSAQLFEILSGLDTDRAADIDSKNPVRMIRAIEIATALGFVPKAIHNTNYQTLFIGLDAADEILKHKIHVRLLERMKRGMAKEVERLHADGLSYKRLFALGLEYRFLGLYLEQKLSKQDMLTQLEFAIWHYAKRQRTWFKRNADITWFDPTKKTDIQKAIGLSKKFLKA